MTKGMTTERKLLGLLGYDASDESDVEAPGPDSESDIETDTEDGIGSSPGTPLVGRRLLGLLGDDTMSSTSDGSEMAASGPDSEIDRLTQDAIVNVCPVTLLVGRKLLQDDSSDRPEDLNTEYVFGPAPSPDGEDIIVGNSAPGVSSIPGGSGVPGTPGTPGTPGVADLGQKLLHGGSHEGERLRSSRPRDGRR